MEILIAAAFLPFFPFFARLIIKTEFLPTKYRGYMLPLSQVKVSTSLFPFAPSPRRFVPLQFGSQVSSTPALLPD